MSPRRIQQRRTKGWRKPEGAVAVGRGTKWGNPWKVYPGEPESRQRAVDLHSYAIRKQEVFLWRWEYGPMPSLEKIRAELAGRDLMCWCPLVDAEGNPVPCHADVLLEIANQGDVR